MRALVSPGVAHFLFGQALVLPYHPQLSPSWRTCVFHLLCSVQKQLDGCRLRQDSKFRGCTTTTSATASHLDGDTLSGRVYLSKSGHHASQAQRFQHEDQVRVLGQPAPQHRWNQGQRWQPSRQGTRPSLNAVHTNLHQWVCDATTYTTAAVRCNTCQAKEGERGRSDGAHDLIGLHWQQTPSGDGVSWVASERFSSTAVTTAVYLVYYL